MTKYALLVILNAPFIIYSIFKATALFKDGVYNRAQLLTRLTFWVGALALLLLAHPLYNFLHVRHLTDSTPLSISDVLLATASFLSFTLIIRLYARVERAERKLTEMNEAIALHDS